MNELCQGDTLVQTLQKWKRQNLPVFLEINRDAPLTSLCLTLYFWVYGRGERREEEEGEEELTLSNTGRADLQEEELHHRSL